MGWEGAGHQVSAVEEDGGEKVPIPAFDAMRVGTRLGRRRLEILASGAEAAMLVMEDTVGALRRTSTWKEGGEAK